MPVRAVLLAVAILAPLAACGEEDGCEECAETGCTPQECLELCEEEWADELAGCEDICSVDAYCLSSGICECAFRPCDDEACDEMCRQSRGEPAGACGAISGNPLSCDCYDPDAGT